MSNYKRINKHPISGLYELAEWLDDYYGPHKYGVYFESDQKTFPPEAVENAQIYDFYIDDVVKAYIALAGGASACDLDEHGLTLELLNEIQRQYLKRWKLDPATGNGATTKSRISLR